MKIDYREMMEAAAQYVNEESVKVDTPEAIADLLRPLLKDLEQESLFVLPLDSRNQVIEIIEATRGLVNQAQAHPREIFRKAIVANAVKIIIAHNHPTGSTTPSKPDLALTEKLCEAGKIIGIEVIDHIIIGKKTENQPIDFASFHRLGLTHF